MASTSRRLPASERRALLLRAAGTLFAEHGYAGATLDGVAAAAGVTKPILYRHFDSKRALYLALLERHAADLPTFFEGIDAPPDKAVEAILARWLDYVRENRHAWVMLFRDTTGDEEIRAARMAVSRRAREVLAAFIGARAGDRIPAEQVEPTAELLTSGLAGLALWWIEHPEVPKRVVMEVALRMSAPAAPSD